MENLQVLQRCLQAMMGRSLTLEQLRTDVGQMVERLTHLTRSFRRIGIRIEEYVTLKVIAMLQNTGECVNMGLRDSMCGILTIFEYAQAQQIFQMVKISIFYFSRSSIFYHAGVN